MGKAKIISGGTDGLYQIEVQNHLDRLKVELITIEAKILEFNSKIPALQSAVSDAKNEIDAAESNRDSVINSLNSGSATLKDVLSATQAIYPLIKKHIDANYKYKAAKLELLELEKRKELLQQENQPPVQQAAWCADFSELLSPGSFVATLEPNGEGLPIIKPANNGNTFSLTVDGQMQPVISSGPNATWFNWAILPGWQKFKPTYRIGAITSMTGDLADVALDAAQSSAQGLDINQTASLSNVPIDYMDCNGGAFEVGDRVVIEFTDQDWTKPKIIGFESNPKPCAIDNFICWPISDSAQTGWGLPSVDGLGNPINPPLGTVGGTSPWVNIQTNSYNLLRFQDYLCGNIYWKSKDSEIPILSWIGPQNGYRLHTQKLSTYTDYVGYEETYFGEYLYGLGKVIAHVTDRRIAGAAIKKTGQIYRLYIVAHYSYASKMIRLLYADIPDLLFNTPITSFTEYELPFDNLYDPYGVYRSDTIAACNQSGTKAAWVDNGVGFEMDLESKTITIIQGSYNESLSTYNGEELEEALTVEQDIKESNFVTYHGPYYSIINEATVLTITETLKYEFSVGWRAHTLLALDYKNDAIIRLTRTFTYSTSESADYTSNRTHTQSIDEFGMPEGLWDAVADNYTAESSASSTYGNGFRVGNIDIVGPSSSTASGSYQDPDQVLRLISDDYTGLANSRVFVARSENATYDFADAFLRFVDLKTDTVIYTRNGWSGTDLASGSAYVRHQVKFNNGGAITFLDQSGGLSALADWVQVRPETESFQIQYASDRYGNRHICSITQNNVPMLNYITNANLVSLLSMTGANPRFNKIGVM